MVLPQYRERICGSIGFAMAPIAFYIVRNSGCSTFVIAAVVLFLISENTTATQGCHIIVDSPLTVISAFTAFAWNSFEQNSAPFSDDWFKWLFLTGVGLGLSTTNWTTVNTFSIVIIQMSTLNDLRLLWRDAQVTWRSWWKHVVVRLLCLGLVPSVVDMITFERMVEHTSQEQFPLVAYGAVITIQHQSTQGYLRSQSSLYITGSKRLQVSLHTFKDDTSSWIIQKGDGTEPKHLEYVRNGDYIHLSHVQSQSRLHSHNRKAPGTEGKNHFEVSGYNLTEQYKEWRLEVVARDGNKPRSGEILLSEQRSQFRLAHYTMKCDLSSYLSPSIRYPYNQNHEATCLRGGDHVKVIWTVESNTHPSCMFNTSVY
ncbi:MAG: MIR motif-containing protein [Benniella sp.]|nr:MAG: MIR motif-containing protein [Benniella sp.]